jgi:hypothetical protein
VWVAEGLMRSASGLMYVVSISELEIAVLRTRSTTSRAHSRPWFRPRQSRPRALDQHMCWRSAVLFGTESVTGAESARLQLSAVRALC